MTAGLSDDVQAQDRLAAIQARVAALREQSASIAQRMVDLQLRQTDLTNGAAREAEAERADHAGEVAQLREALQEMEHEVKGLRIAIQTRGIIEQAKGMLMLQRQCDEDTAFRELVKLSQTSHRKLVEVARALVEAWTVGEHGSA